MAPTHCDLRAPWGGLKRLSSINRKLIHWPFDLAWPVRDLWPRKKSRKRESPDGFEAKTVGIKIYVKYILWNVPCSLSLSLYAINMISICHQLCKASLGMLGFPTPGIESFGSEWVICRAVIGLHRRMQHLSATPPYCLMSWPLLRPPCDPSTPLPPGICPLTRQLHSKHSAQSSQLPTKPRAHRQAYASFAAVAALVLVLVLAHEHTWSHTLTRGYTHTSTLTRNAFRVKLSEC